MLFSNHKALSAKNITGFNIFKIQVYLTNKQLYANGASFLLNEFSCRIAYYCDVIVIVP